MAIINRFVVRRLEGEGEATILFSLLLTEYKHPNI
jgi:hypothetical protein